jgi:ribosome-associated translation inhibitor RaiA
MELSIRMRDLELTDALREQITRHLEFALDTFEDHVEDALVYLIDLKCCTRSSMSSARSRSGGKTRGMTA